jgi:hypothetical protein
VRLEGLAHRDIGFSDFVHRPDFSSITMKKHNNNSIYLEGLDKLKKKIHFIRDSETTSKIKTERN